KSQSLRLKHGWGRYIDDVHDAIVRLDHRGSFLLRSCGNAPLGHTKVYGNSHGPHCTHFARTPTVEHELYKLLHASNSVFINAYRFSSGILRVSCSTPNTPCAACAIPLRAS